MNQKVEMMSDYMNEPEELQPGVTTLSRKDVGIELTWQNLTENYMDEMVWLRFDAPSHVFWTAVKPIKLIEDYAYAFRWDEKKGKYVKGRKYGRVICDDGSEKRCCIDQSYQPRFYAVKEVPA